MALNQAEKMTVKRLPMAERELAQAGKSIKPPKHQAGQRQRCYQRPEAPPRRLGRQSVGRCRQNIFGVDLPKIKPDGANLQTSASHQKFPLFASVRGARYKLHTHNAI